MSSRRRASSGLDDVTPDDDRPPPGRRRVVLHCDADAFFCQVERSRDPSLASVPALAVRQHGDVISVDAGARAAGVTRDDSPSAAREKLRAVGGVLAHVHVVEGHRVSYRPYLAASAALVRLLASEETAEAVARATRRGSDGTKDTIDAHAAASRAKAAVAPATRASAAPALTVEKASIDEAYVQLPAGASLDRDARRAADAIRTLARERLGLVVSVGAASNKFLAKRASATCKPDGVAIVASDEDVAAVLAETPAWKLPGCGGGGVASRMQTALGARTASDVAKKTPAALVAALGLAPAVAERAVLAARGVCDAPVVPRGSANGTVGVHTTLTVAPRRMPARPGFEPVTSASGGRAGMFEPLRVRERERTDGLVDAMARDLAGRVCDDAAAEKRWPRTLAATVATKIAPEAATTTKSKSRAFPARVTKSDATRRATRGVGETREGVSSGQGSSERDVANAVAEACRALVRAATAGADAETLVTKVSLTATGFKPERSGDAVLARAFRKGAGTGVGTGEGTGAGTGAGTGGDADAAAVERADAREEDEEFSPPFYINPSLGGYDEDGDGDYGGDGDGDAGATEGERSERADVEMATAAADGSRPLPVASMWRLLGARKITAEEVRDARRRRVERAGRVGNR